jgi:hypothetical protein
MKEVDAIFDAFAHMSTTSIMQQKINEKKEQINSVNEKRCGNCDHWMKSTCKPEKEHKQFKNMNSMACRDFSIGYSSEILDKKFKEELKDLEEKLMKYIKEKRNENKTRIRK